MANDSFDIMTAFIADIEAKIAALQAVLVSLKSASAMGALGSAIDAIGTSSGMSVSSLGDSGQPIDLPEGAFNGKSLPACVKLYLSASKRKKTIREIAVALREGGVESTSDNFENVVNGALFRLKKTGEVLRFKDGWGLPEWYPANIRASAPTGSSAKRTRKKGKKNGRKMITSEQQVPAKAKASDRIVDLLRTKPEREYSLKEIAEHIGMGVRGARLSLGKLVKSGRAKMSAPGMYAIGKPQLVAAGD
jgi:hypothetical protein